MRPPLPLLLALSVALLGPTGCRGPELPRSGEVPEELFADDVPHALERAEEELALGRPGIALEWMVRASELSGLPTEQRAEVQILLERAAEARIEELVAIEADPEDLVLLTQVQLPRQVAVAAGMAAARRYHELGEYDEVVDTIQELDTRYPMHHERSQAGALLVDAGLALSRDDSGFWIFWSARDDAKGALEYVTIEYPSEPRGDIAYARLAEMYEEDRQYTLAIERHADLILNYPQSPLRPFSQARIPHVRLEQIQSPEYDRAALAMARRELVEWLDRHPDHELRPEVRADLDDAQRRLAESDLGIARFYVRVGNPFGARHHAERAREEALAANDLSRVERAEEILTHLPEVEEEAELPEEAPPALLDRVLEPGT